MPSYTELMLAELRQQRDEQSRQHGELLAAITTLAQATQRLEAALALVQAQAPASAPASAQASAPASAQAQPQAGAQDEAQTPPPAKILHWLGRLGRWVASAFGGSKNDQ